jgi:hypothetical protein
MTSWMEIADQQLPQYSVPAENTTLVKYMLRYWASLSAERKKGGVLAIEREKEEGLRDHNVIIDPW